MTLKPSQSGQPNAPHPAERRLHNLIYSLVYPAFLGSFLFGLLSNAASTAGPPWGILLACYFASQHVEGMTKGRCNPIIVRHRRNNPDDRCVHCIGPFR
jgi:hypothetical protein